MQNVRKKPTKIATSVKNRLESYLLQGISLHAGVNDSFRAELRRRDERE
jgi:hypothetical protein